jgi:hypothetical protein
METLPVAEIIQDYEVNEKYDNNIEELITELNELKLQYENFVGKEISDKLIKKIEKNPLLFIDSKIPIENKIGNVIIKLNKCKNEKELNSFGNIVEIYNKYENYKKKLVIDEINKTVSKINWLIERQKYITDVLEKNIIDKTNLYHMYINSQRINTLQNFMCHSRIVTNKNNHNKREQYICEPIKINASIIIFAKYFLEYLLNNLIKMKKQELILKMPTTKYPESYILQMICDDFFDLKASHGGQDVLNNITIDEMMNMKYEQHYKNRQNENNIDGTLLQPLNNNKLTNEEELIELKNIEKWFTQSNNNLFEYTTPQYIYNSSNNLNLKIDGLPNFELPEKFKKFI